ncbi:hypothetical protein PZN02_005987 (plasmid) [Sinorhizobium garamanticum]|uniref:Transmembrane protein n=1 Tax=Sinorhizobium garamanticum TaxID=680247 RepID=A0ABY8DP20_9HYPH|nr:hypothetical protein [Sinorhizobium garamanticum]WEX91692.1 hypothetical protein PZN02_005987 [Sinorhizobium garamanticum]
MLVQTSSIIASALVSSAIGYAIGLPVSKYFDSNIRMRLLLSPVIGLGIFGAAGVSIFHFLPLTAFNLILVVLTFSAVALWLSKGTIDPLLRSPASPGFSWLAVAFLLCLFPTFEIIPQYYGGSAGVGHPIWDHAKIAIVNEIAQNGLPPANPFHSETGSSNTLIYYYVWHFMAACSSVITGASGWEADIALTGMTALFSTFVVAWLAVARSRCAHAAWWVLPLLLVGSLKPVVRFVSGKWLDNWMVHEHGLQTWIIQAPWVPQHVFSGTLALIAIMAYMRILYCNAGRDLVLAVFMGAMLASAYGSSMWAGGFSLLLTLPIVGALSVSHVARAKRLLQVFISLSVTAVMTVLCAGVLIYEQSSILHNRKVVDFWVFPIFLGHHWFLDVPGFWLVLILLEFGIIYLSFIIWSLARPLEDIKRYAHIDRAFFVSVLAPLLCTQLLHSVIMYNDLGWRVLIPSILVMTALTAALFSTQIGKSTLIGRLTTMTAIILLTPSILSGAKSVYSNTFRFRVEGPETEEGTAFKASPDMWKAVREVTPPNEAVANNPLDLASVTHIPGNISWAILSQRRHCGTTVGFLRAYAAQLTPEQASDVYNFFVDAFEATATEDQLRVMKDKYLCKTLVVTSRDGLWGKPVLDNNSVYKLISEKKGKWRIYR